MKSNPFYATSASAMLLGCWLLSQALELSAGQLRGLLILILVLQVYEALLVGLGAFLVRSGRAPRDGLVVLVIESVFLMDATLLSAECVTTDPSVGSLVALTTAALTLLKLQWVRRAAPDLLPRNATMLLGLHAVVILALPVTAAQLAASRLLSPIVLYGFWWIPAALPLAQRILCLETQAQAHDGPRTHSSWTWMPCALVLLHLWTVGYIHTLDFRPAFLAPLLVGLALSSRRASPLRQLILPALAVVCSLTRDPDLVVHLLGAGGVAVTPLRLALVGAEIAWAYLAWRDRERVFVFLAIGGAVLGLLGSTLLRLAASLARSLEAAVPRDDFGWGTLSLIAAFALLAAGARRSLHGEPR